MEQRYLSVYALNQYLKAKFNQDSALQNVYIKGEISNYRPHSSGHLYFTLKDKNSKINAIMFASLAKKLDFQIENGMQVLIQAQVSVYEVSGQYQLDVKKIEQDGIGKLYLEYESLKKKLFIEGLFDEEHKKEIPLYPKGIAVLSAKQGAALQDILKTIRLRFPFSKVIVFPIPVQGQLAYTHIIDTLLKVDTYEFDVIILARGGGSIEDLWNFNEEALARCIYQLNTPIITGIGHETDFTICDFVSDFRAATPTAAAVKATPDKNELMQNLHNLKKRLCLCMDQHIHEHEQELNHLKKSYYFTNPDALCSQTGMELIHLQDRFSHCFEMFDIQMNKQLKEYQTSLQQNLHTFLLKKEHQLQQTISLLDAFSPLKIMQRGFTLVKKDNQIIKSKNDLKEGDIVHIQLYDGEKRAEIK